MKQEAFGAEFGALTEDDQTMVVGGDGSTAQAVGFCIGYAVNCLIQTAYVTTRLAQGIPVGYADGYGFF
jgi:hypothetical protein